MHVSCLLLMYQPWPSLHVKEVLSLHDNRPSVVSPGSSRLSHFLDWLLTRWVPGVMFLSISMALE